MNQLRILRSVRTARLAAFAVLVAGLSFAATAANAGCWTPPSKAAAAPRIPFITPPADTQVTHADGEDFLEPASIVGLWHVAYTATSSTAGPLPVPIVPPGAFPFLQSYKTWHADGTEFENAFLPPAAGNVCFGVWKHFGNGYVKLHHIGLMFAPDGSIASVFTVDELDRVAANGKTYSGSFDFKLFDAADVLGTGTVLQEIKGTIAATRITVD